MQLGLLPLFWAFTAPLLVADALDVVGGRASVSGRSGSRPCSAVAYLCSVYFLVFGGLAYGVIVGIAALRTRDWRFVVATAGAAR